MGLRPMTIKYVSTRPDTPIPCEPTEDGFYLLRVDGELTVGEWFGNWDQLGVDFDAWTYAPEIFEIEVIKKLDLEELAK